MSQPVESLIPVAGVITAGTYPAGDPIGGLEAVLRLIERVETLGFDTVGVRQRHLERGISSALTVLAAASQRTNRITLETNVVPLGFETPFRLAEDFATVWALAAGRLHVGVSSSAPHADLLAPLNRTDARDDTDAYELIARFLEALRGNALSSEPLHTPYGDEIAPHVQPHAPGLAEQAWLGGGSNRSVDWAAAHGLNLLLGNLTDAEGDAGFHESQRLRIERFRAHPGARADARVGVERVLLPTDGATAEQREHYAAYAAAREARTHVTHGDRRTVIAPDLHGTGEQIAEALAADPVFDGRTELRISLPYGFAESEYTQILEDVRTEVLPRLAWRQA